MGGFNSPLFKRGYYARKRKKERKKEKEKKEIKEIKEALIIYN